MIWLFILIIGQDGEYACLGLLLDSGTLSISIEIQSLYQMHWTGKIIV